MSVSTAESTLRQLERDVTRARNKKDNADADVAKYETAITKKENEISKCKNASLLKTKMSQLKSLKDKRDKAKREAVDAGQKLTRLIDKQSKAEATLRREQQREVERASQELYSTIDELSSVVEDQRTIEDEEEGETVNLPTIFASYNRSSGSDFVEALEKKMEGKAHVVSDKKDLQSWGSFTEFMRSIRDRDFAVLVITDSYLKSLPCMYEVSQIMRERDWMDRVMLAVLDKSVYENKIQYVLYWNDKSKELDARVQEANDQLVFLALKDEIEKTRSVCYEISTFMDFVADRNNPSVFTVLEEIEKRVSESVPIQAPASLAQLTLEKPAENDLSEMSKTLLLRAFNARGTIEIKNTVVGYHVSFDKDEDIYPTDNRMRAEIEDAIEQLEGMSLIKRDNGNNGTKYMLTKKGYQAGEK